MVASAQGRVDREHIYNTLRREIVEGCIAPDQLVTVVALNARFSTAGKVAQEVISALAVDGYLKKTKGGYIPEHWPDDEIEDLLTQLQFLHEICALRLAKDGPAEAGDLQACRLKYEEGSTSDARFLALLEWVRVGMRVRKSTAVVDLAVLIARPAVLRITWAAVEGAPDLPQAMTDVECALMASDVLATRDAVTQFWTIARARHSGVANGSVAPIGVGGEFEVVEPNLVGKVPAFGRSEYRSEDLLARFKNRHFSAQPLTV